MDTPLTSDTYHHLAQIQLGYNSGRLQIDSDRSMGNIGSTSPPSLVPAKAGGKVHKIV